MFSFMYISDVCKQKQMILSWIIIFNALKIYSYWLYNVPFNSRDKTLIKNLYGSKKYSFWRIMAEFLKINCNRENVGMLLKLILETRSTNQRHETGRLKHTRTEENVITVDEMVGLLKHKGQKQTYRSKHQISKETNLTKGSIVQIIHCIFGQKCIMFIDMLAVYYC